MMKLKKKLISKKDQNQKKEAINKMRTKFDIKIK
jgi:hypothetical protein